MSDKIKKLINNKQGEILFTNMVENLQPFMVNVNDLQKQILEQIYLKYHQEQLQLP